MNKKKSSVFSLQSSVCKRRQAAFTLLELLIVIALIMVLAGLMIPAFYKVKNAAKEKKRNIETRIIAAAIQAYKLQEKKLPVTDPDGQNDDETFGGEGNSPNSQVMTVLRDEAVQPPVLDPNKLRWDGNNVVDPDGNQYKITLDLNYNGKVHGDFDYDGDEDTRSAEYAVY